ncbi:dihydrofolate reductase [Candidatus Saccharibacteria bacterium]|nr:dihydrofolate reductase [Candidatus Saccharibacteria bacterium]MBI3338445.1 dihydrofolate reductase [Candidatus Saccharibacteria bacterium]
MIRFIAAIDDKRGIANDHGIPWQGKIPSDVRYYRDKLRTATILMGYGLYQELTKPYPGVSNYVATYEQNEVLKSGFEPVYDARRFLLDLPKAPPTPDQLISADSGLSSLDVAKATSPSVKPLSARADLPWERAILRKSSLENTQGDVWNIGGAVLFASTFDMADELYLTRLQGDFGCTKFFPEFEDKFERTSSGEPITENDITFHFEVWKRKK